MDSGMFLPLQEAAIEALALPHTWFKTMNEQVYQKRKKAACQILDALGCQYQNNQTGMFVWAKIPTTYKNAFDLSDELLYQKNVFITPGGIFGNQGDQYLRISLCNEPSVFEEVLERLQVKIQS